MMRRTTAKCLLMCLAWLGFGMAGWAQSDINRISIKTDLFGPVASMPSNAYFRISPEGEYRLGNERSWGITLDYERYVGRARYEDAQLTFLSGDLWTGDAIQRESSARMGLRRYFGESQKLFGEIQTGFANTTNDTILIHQLSQPYMFSKKFSPELRIRGGYRMEVGKLLAFDWVLEVDPRRLVTKYHWNRVILLELNLGFLI
jgi:hypothetical protein